MRQERSCPISTTGVAESELTSNPDARARAETHREDEETIDRIMRGIRICEECAAHRREAPPGKARHHSMHRVQDPRREAPETPGKDAELTCRSPKAGATPLPLISKLYERTSLLITTNLTFANAAVFGDGKMTTLCWTGSPITVKSSRPERQLEDKDQEFYT